jgi:hypothetical protein
MFFRYLIGFCPFGFYGFSFKTFKLHLPHEMPSSIFDVGFDLVLGGFIGGHLTLNSQILL